MIYYPSHLRYVENVADESELQPLLHTKTRVTSTEWRLSIIVAWFSIIHLFVLLLFLSFPMKIQSFFLTQNPSSLVLFITTAYLLSTSVLSPDGALPRHVSSWATLLGVSSALLATVQYAPQIIHTYRMKLVGALSIPMMLIQTPGGILMVTSIALRKGTNWTSAFPSFLYSFLVIGESLTFFCCLGWITFAVAAVLQGCLLIMCCLWKIRQDKLGIDDFGNPLDPLIYPTINTEDVHHHHQETITSPHESAT